jgi:helicase
MKRPKYKEYERRILEYLVTRTDSGQCIRLCLQQDCRIPKSSLTNVLDDMEKRGLVTRRRYFQNHELVVLTDLGRSAYEESIAKKLGYELPYAVKIYLKRRNPPVRNLFPIQQAFVGRGLLYASDNVCAFGYPGSGKTLLAEMAMVQTVSNGGKALYVTPYKALDWQKYQDFSQWFPKTLNTKVVITDGDNPVKSSEPKQAGIVVATYERIMGALRRKGTWLEDVKVVCADEITLLADEGRGPTIDLLLTLFARRNPRPRIITLSTIVGNALTISKWLDAQPLIENRSPPGIEIEEFVVFREKDVLTYLSRRGEKKTEKCETDEITHIVRNNLGLGMTTLIFVGPRDHAEIIATELKSLHTLDTELSSRVEEFLRDSLFEKTDLTHRVCELLRFGVAFHHAGLHRAVRRFIEKLLKEGRLKTIVATGTLSHGIDYRIDSVIIDYESIRSAHELPVCEYINMKGRAGRYGKSKVRKAPVYILCPRERAEDVISVSYCTEPNEPQRFNIVNVQLNPNVAFDAESLSRRVFTSSACGVC